MGASRTKLGTAARFRARTACAKAHRETAKDHLLRFERCKETPTPRIKGTSKRHSGVKRVLEQSDLSIEQGDGLRVLSAQPCSESALRLYPRDVGAQLGDLIVCVLPPRSVMSSCIQSLRHVISISDSPRG